MCCCKFNNHAASGNNKHSITFYVSACPIIYYPNDLSPIFARLLRPFLVVLSKQPVIKGPGSCFHGNCVYMSVLICVSVCACVFNKMIEIVRIVQKSILHWLGERLQVHTIKNTIEAQHTPPTVMI